MFSFGILWYYLYSKIRRSLRRFLSSLCLNKQETSCNCLSPENPDNYSNQIRLTPYWRNSGKSTISRFNKHLVLYKNLLLGRNWLSRFQESLWIFYAIIRRPGWVISNLHHRFYKNKPTTKWSFFRIYSFIWGLLSEHGISREHLQLFHVFLFVIHVFLYLLFTSAETLRFIIYFFTLFLTFDGRLDYRRFLVRYRLKFHRLLGLGWIIYELFLFVLDLYIDLGGVLSVFSYKPWWSVF